MKFYFVENSEIYKANISISYRVLHVIIKISIHLRINENIIRLNTVYFTDAYF